MDIASGRALEAPVRWSLRLFGGFELSARADGERLVLPSKRDRVLLAYLALSPNHRQSRRKLTALLWGDASDETTLENLRVCIWSLRKALGDAKHQIVASEGDDVVLDVASFDADVLAFRHLAGQPGRAELDAAAKLYTGEFLDGLSIESGEFESWRRGEAARLRDQAIDVSVRLMAHLSECNYTEQAIEIGQRVLDLEPLHEPAIRSLMRLYTENGRRAAAIQLYRTLADALRTQLDAQPEAETRAVFAEIARGDERAAASHTDADLATPTPLHGDPALQAKVTALRRARSTRLIAVGLAAAAVAVLLAQQLAVSTGGPPTQNGLETAKAASASPMSAVSIAVLPFLNLTGDAGQDFFSDGITEEISAALARVPDLRVVARTSAFQFRGQNPDVQSIGRQLRATHLIEGSVRKEGDRVRITAQLIDASSGVRVSSETYDRQLSDIFSTQEDIARNVVSALMTPLGVSPGERLVTNRSLDPESYQQFLRAKWLVPRSGIEGLYEAIRLLEPIVARHPDFAPAWGQLALAYQRIPYFSPQFEYWTLEEKRDVGAEWLSKSEAASTRAIELDANLPDGYTSLGLTMVVRGRLVEAEALLSKALSLDALYPEGLHHYANLLGAVGHTRQALATRRQLLGLEPFVGLYGSGIPDLLWINGDTDQVIANLTVAPSPVDLAYLAKIYSAQGRNAEAENALHGIPPDNYPKGMLDEAMSLLRAPPIDAASLRSIPQLGRRLNFVYIPAGAPEQALERFETDVAAEYAPPNFMLDLWTPIYAPVRKSERFKSFARKAGLVEYWRAKGWPESCRPTIGDDFACY